MGGAEVEGEGSAASMGASAAASAARAAAAWAASVAALCCLWAASWGFGGLSVVTEEGSTEMRSPGERRRLGSVTCDATSLGQPHPRLLKNTHL